MAQVTKEVSSAGSSDRGWPGQAVWLWVGRTKPLADNQDWLSAGWARSSQCNVQYAVQLVKCCSQGNRRGFLGFPPRVSQPAALCGILEDTVMCCDRALDDALCRAPTWKKKNFIHQLQDSLIVHYIKPKPLGRSLFWFVEIDPHTHKQAHSNGQSSVHYFVAKFPQWISSYTKSNSTTK